MYQSQNLWFHSPISDLLIAILELSSLFHFTVGAGLPVALHFRVMLAPSRTIISLELRESSMLGGTAKDRECVVRFMKVIDQRDWVVNKRRRNRKVKREDEDQLKKNKLILFNLKTIEELNKRLCFREIKTVKQSIFNYSLLVRHQKQMQHWKMNEV